MGILGLVMSLFLGVSSNLDNIGIGLSYGMSKTRVPLFFCTIVSVLSFSSCTVGSLTARRISVVLPVQLSLLIGSCILITIGLCIVVQSFISKDTSLMDSRAIRFHEMMIVGIAQAISDLSIGFSSGFTGINGWVTATSIGVFSFAFLLIPSLIYQWIPVQYTRHATFLSGVLLVVVGLID